MLRHLFITLLCICVTTTISAQDFINEDFLDNLEANTQGMWAESQPAFAVNKVPAKFEKESATVLGYRRSVNIDKKSRNGFLSKGERSLIFYENVRFKIFLNDKNAVKSFTTLYFRYNEKEDGFSAKITKPGGSSMEVKLNEAVGIESSEDMPEFYKSFFDQQMGNQRRYYKVAIPDLEPGDILEFVTVSKNKLDVMGSGYIEFTPQYEFCNKKYPILFNQIVIETDDKSFFKSLSLNGAPDFIKETAADPGFFRFVFTDKDRPVEKDVNFVNTYKVSPMTKFQVIYANNENTKGALIGQKGEIKAGFSKDELTRKALEEYKSAAKYTINSVTIQQLEAALYSTLKKAGAKDWSEKDYITKSYYRLRNFVVNRDNYLSDRVAAYIFSNLLLERDIPNEIVMSVSNNIGNLDEVLFDQEIRYAVRVGNSIYFNPTDYSNPGDLVETLMGSNAYVIYSATKKGGTSEVSDLLLPQSAYSDNVENVNLDVSLDKDFTTLMVTRKSLYKGISKNRNISDALKYTTYMLDDYKYYGGDSPTDNMKTAQEEEYYKSVKAIKDRYKEAKPEYVTSQLQNEYSQKVKYKNFTIGSDGRSMKMSDLNYTEEFEINGMIRKAGKKYLVNIPGLVGGQLQIKKEERVRNHPINVGMGRTLSWQINFKIPAGYTVDGLKELTTNIDNEAGSFISAAEEKEGMLVLKITKIYKQANLEKNKWNDMLAFIDAAYNNSYKYILLKPKGS
ncbi:MAG: hypothetical protein ABIT96_04060 [Ferruginibacter sp.]